MPILHTIILFITRFIKKRNNEIPESSNNNNNNNKQCSLLTNKPINLNLSNAKPDG